MARFVVIDCVNRHSGFALTHGFRRMYRILDTHGKSEVTYCSSEFDAAAGHYPHVTIDGIWVSSQQNPIDFDHKTHADCMAAALELGWKAI